jgi:hypothetical protein
MLSTSYYHLAFPEPQLRSFSPEDLRRKLNVQIADWERQIPTNSLYRDEAFRRLSQLRREACQELAKAPTFLKYEQLKTKIDESARSWREQVRECEQAASKLKGVWTDSQEASATCIGPCDRFIRGKPLPPRPNMFQRVISSAVGVPLINDLTAEAGPSQSPVATAINMTLCQGVRVAFLPIRAIAEISGQIIEEGSARFCRYPQTQGICDTVEAGISVISATAPVRAYFSAKESIVEAHFKLLGIPRPLTRHLLEDMTLFISANPLVQRARTLSQAVVAPLGVVTVVNSLVRSQEEPPKVEPVEQKESSPKKTSVENYMRYHDSSGF